MVIGVLTTVTVVCVFGTTLGILVTEIDVGVLFDFGGNMGVFTTLTDVGISP